MCFSWCVLSSVSPKPKHFLTVRYGSLLLTFSSENTEMLLTYRHMMHCIFLYRALNHILVKLPASGQWKRRRRLVVGPTVAYAGYLFAFASSLR